MIVVYFCIFLFSLCVSFFLLQDSSFYNFLIKNYKTIFFAAVIYILPKIVYLPQTSLLLDIGFCITIITDMIEYSVFSIIPITIIGFSFFFLLYQGDYCAIYNNIINIFIIYIAFFLLLFLIKKIFHKDGLGLGDLYFYFIFAWYFNLYFLFLSFFIASLLGLGFILFYKLIFFKKPIKKIIPFIPFLYLSVSLLGNKSFFECISSFLFI